MSSRWIIAAACAAATLAAASGEQKVTLDVKGMTCAACPLTVKTVLGKQPGVEHVKMDAAKNTAEVVFDSSKVTVERLANAVTEAGYPATPRK